MDFGSKDQSLRIHQKMTFATANFLAAIIAMWPTDTGRFHRLAVENPGGRLWFTSYSCSFCFAQRRVNALPQAGHSPSPEIVIDRFPRRKLVWQQAPGTATTHNVQNPIHDLALIMFSRTPSEGTGWQHWLEDGPFSIIEIARIGCVVMLQYIRQPFQRLFRQSLHLHHTLDWFLWSAGGDMARAFAEVREWQEGYT
jgi:hypothetical protein